MFPTIDKNGQHRGGPRPGSGPKPRFLENGKRLHGHQTRPELDGKHHPVHVTMRVTRAIPSLRMRDLYQALRLAVVCVARRAGVFRVVHVSVQWDHVHLLVEARDRRVMTSGLRAFAISAAKRVNRKLGRCGKVFIDRYHATPIHTPTQARNALSYVLHNWKKHGADRGFARDARIDPLSSGYAFRGWLEAEHRPYLCKPPPTHEPLATSAPLTWLLRVGWRLGGTVSVFDRPGPRSR